MFSVRKHIQKAVCFTLFIYSRALNNNQSQSPTVNLIAVTTLLLTFSLHRCWQRTVKKNTNYF